MIECRLNTVVLLNLFRDSTSNHLSSVIGTKLINTVAEEEREEEDNGNNTRQARRFFFPFFSKPKLDEIELEGSEEEQEEEEEMADRHVGDLQMKDEINEEIEDEPREGEDEIDEEREEEEEVEQGKEEAEEYNARDEISFFFQKTAQNEQHGGPQEWTAFRASFGFDRLIHAQYHQRFICPHSHSFHSSPT